MSQRHTPSDPRTAATAATPSEAEQVRCSPERAQRLTDYIQGILPPHISTKVDVIVTPAVETAAVLPATAEALLDADETDLPPEQARQLVEQIDGEYLVLVTAQPTPTDRIPVNDQLTADRAHQFGLAFHETLHILKTAISGVTRLLQEEVAEEYQHLVHDLFNSIEDGAIESEAIEGDNFSDNAAVRLGLTRRIHSPSPDDIDPDDQKEITFWDAVTAALYEYAIYPTGIVDALTDSDDPRLVFTSEADREAFDAVDAELERLAEEALQIRSSERDDVSHTHETDASIKRAKRVLDTWETVLKPVIDDEARDQQQHENPPLSQPSPTDAEGDGDEATPREAAQAGQQRPQLPENEQADGTESGNTDSADGGDAGEGPGELVPADSPEAADGVVPPDALDVDPEDITTEREAMDDPFQDVLDHPSVDERAEPDPDDIDLDPSDYQPAPDDGASSEAGDSDASDSHDGGPSAVGEPTPSEGGEPRSPDAGEPQPSDGSVPNGTDAGGECSDSGASNPTAKGKAALDDGAAAEPDRDAGDGGSHADTPGPEQSGASDGPADTGASAARGGSSTGSDGAEASAGGTEADATPSTADPSDPAGAGAGEPADPPSDGGALETTSSSEAGDLASHIDSGDESDDAGQRTFGDFTGDSNGGGETASASDQVTSDPSAGTGARDATASDDAPGGDHAGRREDTSEAAAGTADTERSPSATDDDADGGEVPASPNGQSLDAPADTTDTSASEPSRIEGGSQENAASIGEDAAGGAKAPAPVTPDAPAGPDEATTTDRSREASGPAHGAEDQDPDLDLEALETDRKRARDTATRSTIDDEALADELANLDQVLDDDTEAEPASPPRETQKSGGGAGPGSLDELTVLPHGDERVPAHEWEQIATTADEVADTLAKELSLDRQSAVRRGRTSGAYDTKTGYRLAYGDPRSFSSDLPGDEKRYTLVIILDRSGSMGNGEPPKIRVATTAVARFAQAAEQLDIDVAVIDFYANEARLVKPFSVAVEHAQGALLAQEASGGTPLSDALALGRTLVESQPTEPLIVTITDGKPRSVDAVMDEITTTYAPVCSLTIATDCPRGDPPAKAQRLERLYDRMATVFDAAMLDDRLDQFASRLAGY